MAAYRAPGDPSPNYPSDTRDPAVLATLGASSTMENGTIHLEGNSHSLLSESHVGILAAGGRQNPNVAFRVCLVDIFTTFLDNSPPVA
jgi:hypothetical protein